MEGSRGFPVASELFSFARFSAISASRSVRARLVQPSVDSKSLMGSGTRTGRGNHGAAAPVFVSYLQQVNTEV